MEINTKIKNKIHQKWKSDAKIIHNEASNIFSLDAFIDCKEIKRRKANRMKKLAKRIFKLFRIVGKNNKSNKKKIAV